MDRWSGTIVALGMGALFVVLAYPLYKRMIGPNWVYGFRIRMTLADPDVWYPVNERSGKHLMVMGLLLILLGCASLVIAPMSSRQDAVLRIAPLVLAAGVLYTCVVGYRMAKELTAQKQAQTLH